MITHTLYIYIYIYLRDEGGLDSGLDLNLRGETSKVSISKGI